MADRNDNNLRGQAARERASMPAGDLRPGQIIGQAYKIRGVIGRGGMGVVYLAEHLMMQRQVALKVLAPDRISEENWERFQAEGKTIARLDHPNIVKVYDMGTDGPDCLYYVMDFLRGMSLAEFFKQRGLPNLNEVMEIFGQVCSGMEYAHKHGLVHRDIKPSNIILCPVAGSNTPTVKVIDFGLVKLIGEDTQLKQSQTSTGRVCGSPFYMSPEQWMGKPVDKRSDVYSLGCTLFECLTGQPPFMGENMMVTALGHQNDAPPRLDAVRKDIEFPENLEATVQRMLQKQPPQRHQSMSQVGQDLLRVKAGKSVSREPIFAEKLLYHVDENVEALLEAPDRTTKIPLAWICALGGVITLFGVWAAYSYFDANNKNQHMTEVLIGKSANPDVIIGRKDTAEMAHAREVYASCPTISNGINPENGLRVFHFPEVPVGMISCGKDGPKYPAKGDVAFPGNQPVTLSLVRGEGDFARLYPAILSKIGAQDIAALEVREPANAIDEDVLTFEVPLSMVQAISGWKELHSIDFYHCLVKDDVLLALNNQPAMRVLKLHNAYCNGEVVARLKWLKNLTFIDCKGLKNVDPLLKSLSGSTNLRELIIDLTMPSAEGLKYITSCPNLNRLALSESDIDDNELTVIANMTQLRSLGLAGNNISGKSVATLSRLKGLCELDLKMVNLNPEDARRLAQALPRCRIIYQKMHALGKGDF